MSISITLTLCNRPFKLKVQPEAEQALRQSIKQMNDTIDANKKLYPGRDDFDYLAMAVMTLISEQKPDGQVIDEDVLAQLKKVEGYLG
jgi:hypothetical protein